jgi:hypothetical protein
MPMIIGQKYAWAVQGWLRLNRDCNSWVRTLIVKMANTAQAKNLLGRFCGMRRQLRHWGNPQVLIS